MSAAIPFSSQRRTLTAPLAQEAFRRLLLGPESVFRGSVLPTGTENVYPPHHHDLKPGSAAAVGRIFEGEGVPLLRKQEGTNETFNQ